MAQEQAGEPAPVILWFRRDLRLADHAAIEACLRSGRPVVPVYVLDDSGGRSPRPGTAARWWLQRSLAALDASLRRRGSRLILRRGPWEEAIPALVDEIGAVEVHAGQSYDPGGRAADARVASRLAVPLAFHHTTLLRPPWAVLTKQGEPFTGLTPFIRACLAAAPPPPPVGPPAHIPAPARWPASASADRPEDNAAHDGLGQMWTPGEGGANQRLGAFLNRALDHYANWRERLDRPGTSMLSPYLRRGEISAATVWHATTTAAGNQGDALGEFRKALLWREFAAHLLWHHPRMIDTPLQPAFANFPWRSDEAALRAWQEGRTGYPVVDGAMREARRTGWLHNRARMVVASFLVKHLLLPWQEGSRWFRATLLDADPASNAASWQWAAGCGTEVIPYFRVFNPVRQGRYFDPEGAWVRAQLPELAGLPADLIHRPWKAEEAQLAAAGIRLGTTYPERIVDHAAARARALAALATIGQGEE